MNIGIVTTWEERGASYVSKQYFDALASRHRVTVFARGGSNRPSTSPLFDEALCHRSIASNFIFSTYIRKREFLSWIRRNRIDVVFFNEQNWWPPVLWCKEIGIRTGSYIDYYTERTIPLFDLYDFLICNTRRHHSAFSWHPSAHYVPWGTDVEVFRPRPRPQRDGLVFFHSCGMSPMRKGTDLVLRAFRRIASNKTRLVVHSQGDLAPFISSQLGMEKHDFDHVEFIEETVSAPGLYHLGDVYVYPSRLDGIGLTIAEALACGLPTIVPDDGPMNEFVTDACGKRTEIDRRYARSDGYYWPMNIVNVDALRQNMQYYVEHPEALEAESAGARAYAVAELDWSKRHAAVSAIFEECMNLAPRDSAAASKIICGEKTMISRAKRAVTEVEYLIKRLRRPS